MSMKLYGARLSPYYERIILQARIKGIKDEFEFPDFPGGDMKSPEYMAISPLGKIPALDVDGFCFSESGVIAEYIEESFSDTPMLPTDQNDRALVRLISRLVDIYVLGPLFVAFGEVRSGTPNEAIMANAKVDIEKGLNGVEHFANGSGANIVGDSWTLADCTLLPAAFFMTRFLQSVGIEAFEGRPKLAAWHEAAMQTELAKESDAAMQTSLEAFLADNS